MTASAYLDPYIRASQQHGARFASLLWASPRTQQLRFEALLRAADLRDRVVLDVGCGRGDFLDFLRKQEIDVNAYVAVEAIPQLVAAARRKCIANARIIEGDFVRDPRLLEIRADVILFSGSLNTLDEQTFFSTLRRAFDSAGEVVAFNFLSSPLLAGRPYLKWHRPREVEARVAEYCGDVREIDDYLAGDCTIALHKDRR